MPLRPIRTLQSGNAPFVQPFLHALNRMQARETLRPEQLRARAQALLGERFGPSPSPDGVAFAAGPAELVSRHAHHFDGFSFLLPLPHGTAVAVRPGASEGLRVAFEGAADVIGEAQAAADGDPTPCLLRAALGEGAWDVAVVGTLRACAVEAGFASLLVAAACAGADASEDADVRADDAGAPAAVRRLHRTGAACVPPATLGLGAVLAARAVGDGAFALTDAALLEVLPVEPAARDALGWGLVDTGVPAAPDAGLRDRAGRALEALQAAGMAVDSFRALEHRDLQRALDRLPADLRPTVRYLVKENQRVGKLVGAVRRGDWQMFGALLLMSHATERDDGEGTTPEADFVVEVAEGMNIEGMYGARASGRGGAVLVVGQPFVVPACLDRIKTQFEARFGRVPETVLL